MSRWLTPEERRRRRILLRQHHPDLGGDPEQFKRLLDSFRRGGSGPDITDDLVFVQRPRGLARLTAWYRTRRRRRSRPRRVL